MNDTIGHTVTHFHDLDGVRSHSHGPLCGLRLELHMTNGQYINAEKQ